MKKRLCLLFAFVLTSFAVFAQDSGSIIAPTYSVRTAYDFCGDCNIPGILTSGFDRYNGEITIWNVKNSYMKVPQLSSTGNATQGWVDIFECVIEKGYYEHYKVTFYVERAHDTAVLGEVKITWQRQ